MDIRPFEEIIPKVKTNTEQVRAALGIPTKQQVETSDPRFPAFMCDPFLNADEFLARTEQAQAIIFVAFASGALPDRLVPAMQQRMNEGIPIFVLSNNPGDKHGILAIHYDAGSEAYKNGAVALQKINVNHHEELKKVIADCLAEGLSGPALTKEIEQRYAFKEGEPLPLAQWDDPNYVAPPRKEIRQILIDSGFMDNNGNYIPDANRAT